MAPSPEIMGGFRRILVRLDAPTRHEYCAAALGEELEAARERLRACAAALAQARQVEDATKQIEASVQGGTARVASPTVQALLVELEGLQKRSLRFFSKLNEVAEAAYSSSSSKRERKASVTENDKDAKGKRRRSDARAVVHELDALLESPSTTGEAAKKGAELVRRFVELLPEQQDKHAAFWRERLKERVVLPVVQRAWLAKDAALTQGRQYVAWLVGQLQAAGRARPHFAPLCRELEEETKALLTKRERKEVRRRDKEKTPNRSKSKKRRLQEDERASTTAAAPVATSSASRMSIHEVRATLSRCVREVKQAGDRLFELAAFDANLKRLVDVVGALSSEFTYDDCTSLTVALFATVEHIEKLADTARRRDRLVCLEGLLKLLIESSDVSLSLRRRTMAKEYLQNCQQSIRLLDRASGDAAAGPLPSTPSIVSAAAEDEDGVPIAKLKKPKKKDASASGGNNHVRFG